MPKRKPTPEKPDGGEVVRFLMWAFAQQDQARHRRESVATKADKKNKHKKTKKAK